MRTFVLLVAIASAVFCAPITSDIAPADITSFLTSLAANDANRADDSQVKINFQNMASTKVFDHDNAPLPLFTSVDESLLQKPTYSALIGLSSFYTLTDAAVEDLNSVDRSSSALNFIDSIKTTNVFTSAWQFLQSAGLASNDYDTFKNQLFSLWFTPFARSSALGSSGFESTFVGEYLNTDVVGLTNWIRFYLLEQQQGINYHGWLARQVGVQVSLQFGLELSVGEKQAMKSSLLFNTSPEFEFMAYTVCFLAGNGVCTFDISGNEVYLNVNKVSVNGQDVIDTAYPTIGVTATATTTKKPTVDQTVFQKLVTDMRNADTDKPASTQYKLDWGSKLGSKPKPSGKNLITSVDETVFNRAVYAALKKVYDNNILVPDVCTSESDYKTGVKASILRNVLDTWSNTQVFTLMHNYLVDQGKADKNVDTFKEYLYTFWFGTYTRCSNKNTIGSSGFEHVFSGEWKSGTVDGHHNWMRYYLNQKAGDIQYYGYYSYDGSLTGTFEYDWKDYNKKEGGFLFGTSPVFDWALYTACSLTQSGDKACRFTIDGYKLAVTSYTQACAGGGTCLSTSYPVDEL